MKSRSKNLKLSLQIEFKIDSTQCTLTNFICKYTSNNHHRRQICLVKSPRGIIWHELEVSRESEENYDSFSVGLGYVLTNYLLQECRPWGCRGAIYTPQILADQLALLMYFNQKGAVMTEKSCIMTW